MGLRKAIWWLLLDAMVIAAEALDGGIGWLVDRLRYMRDWGVAPGPKMEQREVPREASVVLD
jgi:hypothetical protein